MLSQCTTRDSQIAHSLSPTTYSSKFSKFLVAFSSKLIILSWLSSLNISNFPCELPNILLSIDEGLHFCDSTLDGLKDFFLSAFIVLLKFLNAFLNASQLGAYIVGNFGISLFSLGDFATKGLIQSLDISLR